VTLTAAADGTPVVEVEQADGDEEPTTTGTTVDATDQATAATTATTDTTTTTTTPTTTTTTAPPPAGTAYYLTHTEGWLAGSTEGMDPNAPTETVLGDYDDPEDGVAGMRLLPTAEGFESETDPRKVIAFVNSGVGGDTMNGPVAMTLWVATDSDLGGAPTTVAVDVADCNFGWFCTQLASTTAEVTTWVGNGYQPITVTLEPTTPPPVRTAGQAPRPGHHRGQRDPPPRVRHDGLSGRSHRRRLVTRLRRGQPAGVRRKTPTVTWRRTSKPSSR
jgi:hypothetical protein